jgi:phosphate transport system substrate-binding protein
VNISKRRMLAVVATLSIVAVACGSDSKSSSDTTTAPKDTKPTATDAMTSGSTAGSTAAAVKVAGTLIGGGSSAQSAAMQGWQKGFQTLNPDATVEYDPVGSGGGRTTFLAGGSNFAGSDSPLSDDEFAKSKTVCGPDGAINLPHYISPIAVAYNLPGVDGLNLSPAVIAGIFSGAITKWDDPKIAADNPSAKLPSSTINPVHRSDKSGTTKNFTDYLAQTAADVWTFKAIDDWTADGPKGGEGADKTSGMVAAIKAGEGSIGYADESQVGDLQVANIGVGTKFVKPTAEGAAALVATSQRVAGRGPNDYSLKIDRTGTDPSAYPLTLVSYHIVCTQYKDQKTADLVKAFMLYAGSKEGQAAAAEAAGSAPITADLSAKLADAVNTIKAGS